MPAPPREAHDRAQRLSTALKLLRRRRGVRAGEAAARLHMPLRSYEYFESGRGRINVERAHAAAEAMGADPHALMLAAEIGSPAFAARCAENKLATLLMFALQDFDAAAGEDIPLLDPQTVLHHLRRTFEELTRIARDRRRLQQGPAPPDREPQA